MSEYLNIGSIFLREEEGTLPLMVVGYLPEDGINEEIYDYLAVPYPQGYISENSFFMIDHDKVAAVLYDGYFSEDIDMLVSKIRELDDESELS